jgi:hypothetical protein
MKSSAFVLVAISALLALTAAQAHAGATVVAKEQITITVDRGVVPTDVQPISIHGQTLVPVRFIFQAFNADISWYPDDKRVYIRQDDETIWLRVGVNHAKVDNKIVPLSAAPVLYQDRTMVPLRFVAEALGSTVSWDPKTKTITILTKKNTQAGTPQPSIPGTDSTGVAN